MVYGHSSHHPLPLEIHAGKLILYGCGDLINDSEGLPPHGPWRSDLVCCHLLELDPATGALLALTLHPFQLHRFRLRRPSADDRGMLWRQMGLELAPAGWQGRDDGAAWRLEPLCRTGAAF